MAHTQYERITTKQTLNRVKEERMPFDWSINPYRGCGHGCSFCYARAFQSFIGMGAEDEFQHHIFMKANAAEALEKQLLSAARKFDHDIEAMRTSIGQVTIGTATDPYQPIEGKEGITRECLKLLAKYRISTSITTRSPLVLRDMDILTRMENVSVNISLNTLNGDIIRKLEPASPHPGGRLEAMRALSAAGITTGLFVAPVLPFLTDDESELKELLSQSKERGISFAMISLLRLSRDVKKWYIETLKHQFPDVVQSYRELYRQGAYAEEHYVHAFKSMAARLLSEYDLSGQSKREPAAITGANGTNSGFSQPFEISDEGGHNLHLPQPDMAGSPKPKKLPQPAVPVSREELMPDIEQLAFPF
ncbi:Radical SAM domain protein [Paenibacillus vortex V453]|uniref:Radical SAM domain protein n=1 Tax=Paenibacillus vortex V453 TaxID=715225 RepID=A0A2R9SMJ7_9BACL|nr:MULTISPECIES: radical SAM protein [Paenibacillus]EFU38607.1 Radical SAM domain protein [Paenibacillus vortex V453]OMF77469.1 radical SAM protein [Paenibacillus glucanolyticus]